MPSLTTVFRAIVMLAAAVIVVKGWQLYGPSANQIKSFTARAVEMAQQAWSESRPPGEPSATLMTDSQSVAPPLAPLQPSVGSELATAAALTTQVPGVSNEPVAPPMFSQSAASPQSSSISSGSTASIAEAESDRLPALLARLDALGGVDPQLVKWGSGGDLFRFCCRAPLANTPNFSRHFESVAAEPLVAVEQVVAKVEAWRTAQRNESSIR